MAAALHARLAQSCALCRASLPIAALVMSASSPPARFRHRAGAAASRYYTPRVTLYAAAGAHAAVASLGQLMRIRVGTGSPAARAGQPLSAASRSLDYDMKGCVVSYLLTSNLQIHVDIMYVTFEREV